MAGNHFFEKTCPKAMAGTSLGLTYKRQWLMPWYGYYCFFVSLQLCIDFCSNIIIFLLSNKMARPVDAFLRNYGDHAGI
jgi:hypothetical protein